MGKQTSRELFMNLLKQKGIHQCEVLTAIRKINRAKFVNPQDSVHAYEDRPLAIGCEQTISQPYIVAKMTELVLNGHNHLNNVLEIGTGSGYQAAVLSSLAKHVYSIERIEILYQVAKKRLAIYKNIQLFLNDDIDCVNHYAPFDGILVTACCQQIAPAWLGALTGGGCLVLPMAVNFQQKLTRVIKIGDQYLREFLDDVNFVPLKKGLLYSSHR